MKKFISLCLICMLLFAGTCLADEYNLQNMTAQELTDLKSAINKQLEADHNPTSSEKDRIESAIKTYVEDYYGSDNVSWAWFDYTYTKEWDYFTMSTHADVTKGKEEVRCDIDAEIYRHDDIYEPVYVLVGNDELLNTRNEVINDERVRKMLGLSGSVESGARRSESTSADVDADTDTDTVDEDADASIVVAVEDSADAVVVAKKGDRNDTVKDIQNMLIRLGYLSGKADGDYGKKTESAVKAFQADKGMEETGSVTEDVYAALQAAGATVSVSPTYESYTAKEVYNTYDSNEIAGDSKFKGKTIEVTGKIYTIGTSLFGTPRVVLKADSYGFETLSFEFSSKDIDRLATLKENQSVTIRAKCTGFGLMEVYFEDSELVK